MKRKILIVLLAIVMVAAAAVGISACGKVKEVLLKAPENITYDGIYITWDKVKDAEYYMVQINEGESVRSNSTTYYYEAEGEAFDVTVSSVLGETQESTSTNFKPLATIESVTVDKDGSISWDSVSGANAYQLSVNGEVLSKTITDTRYSKLPEGSNRVKVKPVVSGDNTFYSFWSYEVNITIYSAPTRIRYDGTTLTWQGNAASYEVNINGKISTVKGNSMDFNSENRDFNVTLKALGNYSSTYDSKTASEDFYYLDTVKELTVEDGILKWDGVDRAESYKIRVNGVVLRDVLTEPQYEKLAAGESQDVQVMPVNETGNYFSSWSAEKTVYILDTPIVSWNNDLELDGVANNNLTWNAVNAAAGYTVRLTDPRGKEEIETFSDVQMAFAHAYTAVGKYTVEVKATAASGSADHYDSRFSEAYTIERLAAPKAAVQNFIVSNKDSLAEGFTVNYVPVSGAAGYQLYKDGALRDGKNTMGAAIKETDIVDGTEIGEQHITYMVRSTGSYNAARREVKLPSLSVDSLSFDIIVLAVPQAPEMSGFTLSWGSVSNANGYSVAYAGKTVTAQGENYDLSTLNAGSYSVAVCARGNGEDVLASNFSSPVGIQRLEAPTNIKITADNNGTIGWDDVANAKSYQVFLDLSESALDAGAWDNMYQFIETDGTTVNVLTVANYYNDNHTLYYMTSQKSPTQQFIRLAAPEFPEGVFANSNQMVWNTPSNINTAEYTPTYRLYSQKGEQIGGGEVNGTRFDISYLEGGKSYTFLVKAIGNDSKYLDSDYSISITVYKLATPEFEVDVENGQYVWKAVANASSYYMEIDGVKVTADFHVSGSTYYYTPRYTEIGDHIVMLKAVGDGRKNLDSAAYTYTQKTEGLSTPVISVKYSSDSVVNGGKIIVTITTPSVICKNYQYEIAGQSNVSSALSYEKVMQSAGTYAVRVKALGGVFDKEGVYYVDSLYAGGNDEYKIILLAKPGNFSINSDGVIQWKSVQNDDFGYEYQLSFDGAAYGEIEYRSNAALDPLENHKQYKTITIRIRAKGNGSNVIASEWSEWTWTNRG